MGYNSGPPIATLGNISKNFQAKTTIETTYSKYSHVATWSDYDEHASVGFV